jgi:aspartate racemase
MGPAATVDFMDKLLQATGAEREQDNLRLLVDCNPHVPDRNHSAADGPQPGPVLADMARGLERQGAQIVVMPCNTAHKFTADIRAALVVPFVSLIDETAATLARHYPHAKRVGLLATTTCIDDRLYQDAFANQGVDSVTLPPADATRLMTLIYQIKRGDRSDAARAEMKALADVLIAAGAEVVVAACTEVPLLLGAHDVTAPLLDTTQVLVERTLAYARDGETIPAGA